MTWQLAFVPLPLAASVQGLAVKLPGLSLAKLTDPVGVSGLDAAVSETVAVQVVEWLTLTLAGEQLTVVEVGSGPEEDEDDEDEDDEDEEEEEGVKAIPMGVDPVATVAGLIALSAPVEKLRLYCETVLLFSLVT